MFKSVSSDYFPDNRQLEVNVNRDQASSYGVGATMMAQNIASAYAQNYSYLIKSDYLQYWVVVEAQPLFRSKLSNLTDIYFDSLVNQNPLFSQNTDSFLERCECEQPRALPHGRVRRKSPSVRSRSITSTALPPSPSFLTSNREWPSARPPTFIDQTAAKTRAPGHHRRLPG